MQASSYTPSDAQVLTHIAFVAEFSLSCSNGASNVALYADLNGALVPVVRSQDAGGRFVKHVPRNSLKEDCMTATFSLYIVSY